MSNGSGEISPADDGDDPIADGLMALADAVEVPLTGHQAYEHIDGSDWGDDH